MGRDEGIRGWITSRLEGKVGGSSSSFGIEQVIGDLLLNSLRCPCCSSGLIVVGRDTYYDLSLWLQFGGPGKQLESNDRCGA